MAMSETDEKDSPNPADGLEELSPAERFERLMTFPTAHVFKLVGTAETAFIEAVRQALGELGHVQPRLEPRYSRTGKYVSLSCELEVRSGAELAAHYDRLKQIPGIISLL